MFFSKYLLAGVAMAWMVFYNNTIPADDNVKKGDLLLLLASSDHSDHVEAMRVIDHYDFSYTADYRIIPGLISMLHKELEPREEYYNTVTPRNLAIRALGKLRAREAVPALIEWLEPKAGQICVMDQLMCFGHAGYALVEIGPPAVRPLLDKIRTEEESALEGDCVKIAVGIIGIEEVKRLASPHVIKRLENPDRSIRHWNKQSKGRTKVMTTDQATLFVTLASLTDQPPSLPFGQFM